MTLADYVATYRATARQLATLPIIGQWRQAGVPADEAAQWANRGYLPAEAEPMIADGVSPDLVQAVETAICDDPLELAALTLDLMIGNGQ